MEWSQLLDSWQQAESTWKDRVATQFAKRFMAPWEAEMPAFLSALDTLVEELHTARQAIQ